MGNCSAVSEEQIEEWRCLSDWGGSERRQPCLRTDSFTSSTPLSYLTLVWSGSFRKFGRRGGAGRLTKARHFSLYSPQPVQNIDQVAAQYLLLCSVLQRQGEGQEDDRGGGGGEYLFHSWKSCCAEKETKWNIFERIDWRKEKPNSTWQEAQTCPWNIILFSKQGVFWFELRGDTLHLSLTQL